MTYQFSTVFSQYLRFIVILLQLFHCEVLSQSINNGFNVVGGQIYTPGLAIVNSPQPFTPMGGDFLHISIDISGNGRLRPPPNNVDPLSQLFNITLFLTSYDTNKNFTISNGTTRAPPLAPILNQEPGSTVKHVNWAWPGCLVGDGQRAGPDSARGQYNITIHQNYRLNGTDFFTIFNLPISVTNSIPERPSRLNDNPEPGPFDGDGGRISCDLLQNRLLSPGDLRGTTNVPSIQPYLEGPVSISSTDQNQDPIIPGSTTVPGFNNPNSNNPSSNNPNSDDPTANDPQNTQSTNNPQNTQNPSFQSPDSSISPQSGGGRDTGDGFVADSPDGFIGRDLPSRNSGSEDATNSMLMLLFLAGVCFITL
ncbi:hypothetical protein M501DRAFT_939468 [Patellaria atrata CBS 101060]|uniref:Uncharacterized protein n=1 Tax=Patellaria atrata CBS 101060 TaxID=1346257 RepID=A0A9P4S676_9PEZI|nr:hypothetical protein M501DRAFT_939468 [Patellaria atrata CBS 101060]